MWVGRSLSVPNWFLSFRRSRSLRLAFACRDDGDAIADRTGLGAAWIGAILVAAATSLPELVTADLRGSGQSFDLAMGISLGPAWRTC